MNNTARQHKIRRINHKEFCNLKQDDIVYVMLGNRYYQSRVIGNPFCNVDADEPDWEVETTNGFCDEYSLYIVISEY